MIVALIFTLFSLVLVYLRPFWASFVCLLLFFSGLNVAIEGFFVNLRAILTFALFIKLFNSQRNLFYKELSISWIAILLIFYLYGFITDLLITNKEFFELVKILLVNFCIIHIAASTYLVDKKIIYLSLIFAGLVCLTDLIYTLTVFEEFPIRRITALFLGTEKESNHNFFGMICSLALIVSIAGFKSGKSIMQKVIYWSVPIVMFVGVLLSTSRSSLLGLMVVGMIYIYRVKGIYTMSFYIIGLILFAFIMFSFVTTFFSDSKFYEIMEERVINEPMTVIYKLQGKVYKNKTIEGSGMWREESAYRAVEVFVDLPLQEQVLGIGTNGYVDRNYANGLQPHNGFILLLIERGIIAFVFFVGLLLKILQSIVKRSRNLVLTFLFLFLIIYSIPQNSELTSGLMVIIISSLAVEQKLLKQKNVWHSREAQLS